MFRIDTSTASETLPAPGAAGAPGYFTGGDPQQGVPATHVSPDFMNMLQEELVAVILDAGLSLDKVNRAQLLAAINAKLGAQTLGAHADVTVSGVADGQAIVWSDAASAFVNSAIASKDLLAHRRIALLMFNRLQDQGLPPEGLIGDFYDSFVDDSAVDAGSTGALVESGALHNKAAGALSATNIASASYHIDDGNGWSSTGALYDGGIGAATQTPEPPSAGDYCGQLFPTPRAVGRLRFYNDFGGELEGIRNGGVDWSDDGVAWTEVASFTDAPKLAWTDLTWAYAGKHRYWRLRGDTWWRTANFNQLAETEWYEFTEAVAALDYRSTAVELAVEPVGAQLTFTLEDADAAGGIAAALGGTIAGYLSKDDGATWEEVSLAVREQVGDLYAISGAIAEMAAAGDKTMRQRLVLPGTSAFKIHAAGLQAI